MIKFATQTKGNLVIIGGGDKPTYIMQKIVELAGGPDAKIIVIPNASSDPEESAEYKLKNLKILVHKCRLYNVYQRTLLIKIHL